MTKISYLFGKRSHGSNYHMAQISFGSNLSRTKFEPYEIWAEWILSYRNLSHMKFEPQIFLLALKIFFWHQYSGFGIRFWTGFRIWIPDSDSQSVFWIRILDSESRIWIRIRNQDSESGSEFGFWILILGSDSGVSIRILIHNLDSESGFWIRF